MSKLDEIRNRLKKDSDGGSLIDRYNDSKKSILDSPKSKDVGTNSTLFSDAEDQVPVVLQAHKRAIFIGNNQYDENPLSKCVNDARSMQHIFSKIGYRLVYDFDLNSEKMHKLFERFKSDIEEGDELLIYFSGHGAQVNSEIYLTPVDSPNNMLEAFSTHFINLDKEMDDMLACGAKMVVAIVDACRNQLRIDYQNLGQAAYEQGMEDALKMMHEKSSSSKFAKNEFVSEISPELLKSKGKAILFASSHGTYSYDSWHGPELTNGVFTHFFLKEVVKPGRTITEVIERVRGLVSEYTDGQQIPAFHNNLPGDYYFIDQS